MLSTSFAEWMLARLTAPERAAAITGDLAEEAATRGIVWFWLSVFRIALTLFWRDPSVSEEIRLGFVFGLVSGFMWMGLFVLTNLGGTSVLGNIRDTNPGVFGTHRVFGLGGLLLVPVMTGLGAAYRMGGSMRAALRVGACSGLIGGVISLITLMSVTVVFHDAMMLDPANIHEFALSVHRPPTNAELSHFLYWDSLGGGLNMLWIGPLLGVTIGTLGAFFGKAMFRGERNRRPRLRDIS